MRARKLVVLLVIGGLAGVVFAGMTTGAMRPYREHHAERDYREAGPDDAYAPRGHASWLDEGLSLLENPAWPFGRSADEPAPQPMGNDYDPYYGDGANPDFDAGDPYAAQPGYRAPGDTMELPVAPAPQAQSPDTARGDAAADAAADAADTAQDVIAAEHGT